MSSFFIQPIGFPERENVWLEAILTIGRNILHDKWQWTLSGPAEVYLVAVESVAAWERYRAEFSSSHLVACALPSLDIDARWRIDRDREKLPALRQVTQVLNALGAEIASTEAIPSVAAAVATPANVMPQPSSVSNLDMPESSPWDSERLSTGAVLQGVSGEPSLREPGPEENIPPLSTSYAISDDTYDPEKYLMGIVRECLADGMPRRMSCSDGDSTVVIDPARNQCVMQDDEPAQCQILSLARDRIEVRLLSKAELMGETLATQAHTLPITDLLFLSVLLGSQGRMWAGCQTDEPIRLKQWPGLGHLPDSVEYINLAAFMSGNNADIKTIVERTGMSQRQVIDFHNACMAVDLLDRGGEVVVREKSINPSVRDLYQKIAKRLQGEV